MQWTVFAVTHADVIIAVIVVAPRITIKDNS